MDFISVSEFQTQPEKVWARLAKAHRLVVTRNGKPFAILSETSPTKLDADLRNLGRSNFSRTLAAVRSRAGEKGVNTLPLDQINAIIREARDDGSPP